MKESSNLGCRRTVILTLLTIITIITLLSFGMVVAPLEQLQTQPTTVETGR